MLVYMNMKKKITVPTNQTLCVTLVMKLCRKILSQAFFVTTSPTPTLSAPCKKNQLCERLKIGHKRPKFCSDARRQIVKIYFAFVNAGGWERIRQDKKLGKLNYP